MVLFTKEWRFIVNRIRLIILILTLIMMTFVGCSSDEQDDSASYIKISGEEAKKMMDEDDSVIILDVRTEAEYSEGHIEGAILIPNTEIKEKASELLPEKSATILIYCRSGNRSASAASELVDAGYTNVYDFGGIMSWSYDIVVE